MNLCSASAIGVQALRVGPSTLQAVTVRHDVVIVVWADYVTGMLRRWDRPTYILRATSPGYLGRLDQRSAGHPRLAIDLMRVDQRVVRAGVGPDGVVN